MSSPDPADKAMPAPADPPTRIPLALEDSLTVIIMALLALITFANVLVRYFTQASFAWTEEISIFLMVLLTMVAGSAAFARDRHIRIDAFTRRGSARRRWALARFGTAMVIVLFALITVVGARMVMDEYEFGETSPGIGVPQWWYTIWLPILSALITLRAIGLYIRQTRAASALARSPSGSPPTSPGEGPGARADTRTVMARATDETASKPRDDGEQP